MPVAKIVTRSSSETRWNAIAGWPHASDLATCPWLSRTRSTYPGARSPAMERSEIIEWLLEGDPAVRWQVRRDLLGESKKRWHAEQAKVATEGWGARLLQARGEDGQWAGGLYTPKWTSTTYTLLELRRLGLPATHPAAIESANLLLERRVWMRGPRSDYWEACVAGFALSLSCWFEADSRSREALASEVLGAQMPDGGWNCRRARGATHSSFHTTINVLEGLRDYIAAGGRRRAEALAAEARAQAFFCAHQLYRSHRTGRVVDEKMTRMPFPPRWRHDVLRTLDYFQAAGAARDPRLLDPITLVETARKPDGRWPQHAGQSGRTWLTLESLKQPSRWNTLRALRVLRWWH